MIVAQALAGAFLFGGEFQRRLTFTSPDVKVKGPRVARPELKSMCRREALAPTILQQVAR